MKTTITLIIEDTLVAQAEQYAKSHGTSVSAIVEQYIRGLEVSSKSEPETIAEKYAGLLKNSSFAKMTDLELKDWRNTERYMS